MPEAASEPGSQEISTVLSLLQIPDVWLEESNPVIGSGGVVSIRMLGIETAALEFPAPSTATISTVWLPSVRVSE